ncbi:unnamed protein product [Dicrocoelium dendriticum]|nr:unnamed protein product [Dicrocoelium dendriticum]
MNRNHLNTDIYEPGAYASGVGCRVVRGPDWKWNKQDGGEGHVGTVRRFDTTGEAIVVWDSGIVANYRCGILGFDLRVLDSSPTGIKHPGTVCEGCQESPIYGVRWKCAVCLCVDLCSGCYHGDKHSLSHHFLRIVAQYKTRVIVGRRLKQRRIESLGLFAKARVVRGIDWSWDSQDCISPVASTGGSLLLGSSSSAINCHGLFCQNGEQMSTGPVLLPTQGRITDRRDWYPWTPRSAALVAWDSGAYNVYRVGYAGLMDLKAIRSSKGGSYYVDHLPLLADLRDCPGEDTCQRLEERNRCTGEEDVTDGYRDSGGSIPIPNVTNLQDLETRRRRTTTVFNDGHVSTGRSNCIREEESASEQQPSRCRITEFAVQDIDRTQSGHEPAASSCLNVCTLASRLQVQPTPMVDCRGNNTGRHAHAQRHIQTPSSSQGSEVEDISTGRTPSSSGGGLRTFGQTARSLLTDLLRANSCASSTVTVQNRLPTHHRSSVTSPPAPRRISCGTVSRNRNVRQMAASGRSNQDRGTGIDNSAQPQRRPHEASNLEALCNHTLPSGGCMMVDTSTPRCSFAPCARREQIPRRLYGLYNEIHESTLDPSANLASSARNCESSSCAPEGQADASHAHYHSSAEHAGEELIRAAEEGDAKRLKCLLQHRHVNVNTIYAGSTALHTACDAGHLACVSILMYFGAKRLLRDGTGNQAVHSAAQGGNINVLQLVLSPRPSLRMPHFNTDDPPCEAHDSNSVDSPPRSDFAVPQFDCAEEVDDVPDVNSRNALRQTALHLAVTRHDLALAQCLLEDFNALSSLQDCDGDTPLHDAIAGQDERLVELLLKHNADLTITNNSGQNPLHYAVIQGEAKIVRIILQHCLTQTPWLVDEPQPDGLTALHLAAFHGHLEVCDLLLQAGANSNCAVHRPAGLLLPQLQSTTRGDVSLTAYTPLHLAVHKEHPDVVCMLLCYGARATGRSGGGRSPMQLALTALSAQADDGAQYSGHPPKKLEVAMVPFLASVARLLICMADSLIFTTGPSSIPSPVGALSTPRYPSGVAPANGQHLISIEDEPGADDEGGSYAQVQNSPRLILSSPLSRRLKSTIQATLETRVPRLVLIAACLASAIGAEHRLPSQPDTDDEVESDETEGRTGSIADNFVTDVFSESLDPVLQLALQQCHMESMNLVSTVRTQMTRAPDADVRCSQRTKCRLPQVDAGTSAEENLVDLLFQVDSSVHDPVGLMPSTVCNVIDLPMRDSRNQPVTAANPFNMTLNNAHRPTSSRLMPPSLNEIDPEWRECLVCSENDRATVAIPCGHIITCDGCSSLVKKCLLCRQRITGFRQFTNCCECQQAHGVIVARPCNHMLWCGACLQLKVTNLDAASALLHSADPIGHANEMMFTPDANRRDITASEHATQSATAASGEWREVPLSQLLAMINSLSTLLDDLAAGGLCIDGCPVCNAPVETLWPIIVSCAGVEYRSTTLANTEADLILNAVSPDVSNRGNDSRVVTQSYGTGSPIFNADDGITNFMRQQFRECPRETSHNRLEDSTIAITGATSMQPVTPNNHLHHVGARGETPMRGRPSQPNGRLRERELSKLKHELQVMREQIRCPICLDRSRNLVFMCGHATCQWCGDQVTSCPICRRTVESRIILY